MGLGAQGSRGRGGSKWVVGRCVASERKRDVARFDGAHCLPDFDVDRFGDETDRAIAHSGLHAAGAVPGT